MLYNVILPAEAHNLFNHVFMLHVTIAHLLVEKLKS